MTTDEEILNDWIRKQGLNPYNIPEEERKMGYELIQLAREAERKKALPHTDKFFREELRKLAEEKDNKIKELEGLLNEVGNVRGVMQSRGRLVLVPPELALRIKNALKGEEK